MSDNIMLMSFTHMNVVSFNKQSSSHLCSVLHLLAHLCLNSSGVGGGFTAQHAHHVAQLHLGFGGLQQALPDQILNHTRSNECNAFNLVIIQKACKFGVGQVWCREGGGVGHHMQSNECNGFHLVIIQKACKFGVSLWGWGWGVQRGGGAGQNGQQVWLYMISMTGDSLLSCAQCQYHDEHSPNHSREFVSYQ